jgi:hypothetical protein
VNNITNIKSTAKDAYYYARYVIKGRWIEGETLIATDPMYAYYYANYIIKDRWLDGEPIIATDYHFAYLYACYMVKGRWLEGELQIMFSEYASDYAELSGELYL